MSTTIVDDEPRQRRLGRLVSVGTVALLVLAALVEVEAWPLTSFRLFSTVRTGSSASLTLVAVAPDGTATPLRMPGDQVFSTTTHQYPDLAHEPAAEQRAKVDAWLAASGVDPAAVAHVDLVRTTRTTDAAGVVEETGRTVVVQVVP